jgi:ATP-dependent protease Clp ATPase subunit
VKERLQAFLQKGAVSILNKSSYKLILRNILFIVAGAFVGLDKIIDQRQNKKPSVGLGQQKS